ncbi:hypothetical protein ONZ43_g1785 [Nemania bipapillata]|uniref:Uncharacterized protein n=1 Tax=Nemania bipapillata TaxID=110536 RepID=A0ACC2J398_9PEZI|nr:hypothetical protein ONZ43_g1785 [Nemania bipapillata]
MPPLPLAPSIAQLSPPLPLPLVHPRRSPIRPLGPRTFVGATTVPQGYGNSPFGPDSGAVAGIVLGSVAGFLLLLALLYWCVNLGQGPRMREEGSVGGGGGGGGGATASIVSWASRPRGPPRKHPRRSRRASRREKVEVRRERVVPVRVVEREDQIVVEEFQSRSRSRSRSPPRSLSRGPPPLRRSRNDGDDMIIVEEDPPSPRRRRDSMRSQRTRRSDDRRGSFREDVYMRDVSRQRSRSRA